MIALQLALTIVLVRARADVKSVWRLTSHPAGFTPEQILTMRMDFTGPAYRDDRAGMSWPRRCWREPVRCPVSARPPSPPIVVR